MESLNEKKNAVKTPTLNPREPIDRFQNQSKLAKWINNNFCLKMDHYTNARSTLVLLCLVYLLGKNLNWFLKFLVFLHFYLIFYRFIRFWIKRWLMFMIDICYLGNFLMIYFILFDSTNLDLFLLVFAISSGLISLAVVVCDNQADLSNTDFLTSCFIHTLPVTTMWAIRWKHMLYPKQVLEERNCIDMGNVPFAFDETFFKLLVYPYVLWFIWATYFFFLNQVVLRKYAFSDYYDSSIGDFYKSDDLECLFGDHKRYTVLKFLIQHLIFMFIVTPLSIFNFYSFYFNSGYIMFIIIFLGYNQAKKNKVYTEQVLEKVTRNTNIS